LKHSGKLFESGILDQDPMKAYEDESTVSCSRSTTGGGSGVSVDFSPRPIGKPKRGEGRAFNDTGKALSARCCAPGKFRAH